MVTKRKLFKRSIQALALLAFAVYFYVYAVPAFSQPPAPVPPQNITIVEMLIVGIFGMLFGVLAVSLYVIYRMKHGGMNLYQAWYGDGTLRTRKGKLVYPHGVVEYDIYVKFADGNTVMTAGPIPIGSLADTETD